MLAKMKPADLGQKRQVLVIGGAGYIGSVLVRKLLFKGYKVKVLDNLLYDNGSSVVDLLENPNFSFIRADFCDGGGLNQWLKDISDIVLLAALVGDPICKKYPEIAKRINEEGSIRLFESLNGRGIDKFIFTSTCSNYGLRSTDQYATEEVELNPQSLYAETKVTVERYILEKKDRVDFCPVILRLATAYGLSGRMRFDLTISEFTRELVLGKDLLVYDENTWRPYCHVVDISEVIIKVIESPKQKVCREVFNVGSNKENYTKKMIVGMVLSYLKKGNVQYKKGGFDPRNYRVSFGKLASNLGFVNNFTIKDSIPKLIEAIRGGLFDDVEKRIEFYGNYSIKKGNL